MTIDAATERFLAAAGISEATRRAYGADLRVVPAAPYTNPANYYHEARRVAEATPGAVWANQFENTANRDAHERTTRRFGWCSPIRTGRPCSAT